MEMNDERIIRTLLAGQIDIERKSRPKRRTPLAMAASLVNHGLVALLLQYGALVGEADMDYMSPSPSRPPQVADQVMSIF